MDPIPNSPFRLESFTVVESHVIRGHQIMKEVNVDIVPKGVINRAKKNFSLILEVKVDDGNSFDIAINCIGLFKFKADIKENELSSYFLVNAPAIIFPYIRSYISAITALSGLPAINLPVMNLSSLKKSLENNISEIVTPKKKLDIASDQNKV